MRVPQLAHCAPHPFPPSSTATWSCSEGAISNKATADTGEQALSLSRTDTGGSTLGKPAAGCSYCVVLLWSHQVLPFPLPPLSFP